MNKLRLKKVIIFSILFLAVFAFVKFALAQQSGPDVGLDYAAQTGLSAEDPRIMVARIIRIFMGFLGIIAVCIILYAGWLWMSAGGSEEKINTAKKLLLSAIIGLIVILSAFAIASFILSRLTDATSGTYDNGGGTPGGGTGPGGGGGAGLISCDGNPFTSTCEKDAARCGTGQYCGGDCYCHDRGGWGASCDSVASTTACEADNDMCMEYLDCKSDQGCRCLGAPVIKWISPMDENEVPNGAPGNFVTIGGVYFGTSTGKVYFSDASGEPTVLAPFPDTVNPKCNKNWKDTQIIVIVPAGARKGPIKVVRPDSENDTTNNTRGPSIKDFEVNSNKRPGVCLLNPDSGFFQDAFAVEGTAFNGTKRSVLFGNRKASTTADNISGWTNTEAKATIPNIKPGEDPVYVTIDNVDSNSLVMSVLYDISSNPIIDYIDPSSGPVGQYITIYGKNFQSYKSGISQVKFFNPTTKATTLADGLNLAAECRDNWWHNTYITVQVPKVDELGKDYTVTVTNADARVSPPAPENFNVKTGDPGPGLCLLDPHNSPVGYPVNAYGDKFGTNQANGKTIFYNNVDGVFDTTTSWANQKVVSKVPSGAITGPFVVVDTKSTKSNSLPFTVGKCSDSKKDCETGEVCCQSGTYWDGICRKPGNGETEETVCNKGKSDLGAYGWTFSTTPPQPDTCAGYTTSQACADASTCPNSPGLCQTSNSSVVGNGCGNSLCSLNYTQCANNACTFDNTLNRCKITGSTCNATSSSIISGKVMECRLVNSKAVWQYNPGGGSCDSADAFLDLNGWCTAGTLLSPQTCNLCPSGFGCFQGQCAAINQTCPQGSSCVNDKCVATNPVCECCCRVGQDAQDCCAGLKCTAGNCGAGAPNYGLCTGCKRDLNSDGQVTTAEEQAASDAACNCVAGKKNRYCDLTDSQYPDGVCRDNKSCDGNPNTATCEANASACSATEFCNPDTCNCEQAPACDSNTTSTGCQPDNTMCEDNNNNFVQQCDNNTCYCQPKSCNATPGLIDPQTNLSVCTASSTLCSADEYCDNEKCICRQTGLPLGSKCYSTSTQMCDLTCSNPYTCLGKSGENKSGPICTDKSCLCCCDPLAQPPVTNSYGLSCYANKTPCDGDKRGLFCGCTSDEQCEGGLSQGCGLDTCCRPRPQVESTVPTDTQMEICRNAVLSATFDRVMSVSSFVGNIIVVGDYGSSQCPKNTQYLAQSNEPKTKFAKLIYNIASIIKKVLSPFFPFASAYSAPQATHNYCAITGKVSSYNSSDGKKTTVEFSPTSLYDPSTKYYVILKGDTDTIDNVVEGVYDAYKIGMATNRTESFNKIEYKNSYIWQFTTMSDQGEKKGICTIDHVNVIPTSYLFKTATNDLTEVDSTALDASFDTAYDKDKVFRAEAVSKNKQKIAPVTGYAWEWDWTIDNTNIVSFMSGVSNLTSDKKMVEAKSGITDGKTFVNADARITEDSFNTGVTNVKGSASAYVFICENPWPAVTNGEWNPWRDRADNCTQSLGGTRCDDTGYEIYYCRDKEKTGTADDLPAILSGDTIIRASSSVQNLLKEFYFFREAPVATPSSVSFNVVDAGTGGAVIASWPVAQGAASYKLYYGTKSHNYSYFVSATGTQATVKGLTNKTKYYFAYTSLNEKMVESSYSDEMSVTPTDITPPGAPQNVTAVSSEGKIDLTWEANGSDAVGYKVQYGTASGVYGKSSALLKTTKYTISGLTAGMNYYIVVKAIDINKNEINSQEVVYGTPPNTPKNVKAVSGDKQITLSWSANTDNATGYKVYYGTDKSSYASSTTIITTTNQAITNLLDKTIYYFKVVAINVYGNESSGYEIFETTN